MVRALAATVVRTAAPSSPASATVLASSDRSVIAQLDAQPLERRPRRLAPDVAPVERAAQLGEGPALPGDPRSPWPARRRAPTPASSPRRRTTTTARGRTRCAARRRPIAGWRTAARGPSAARSRATGRRGAPAGARTRRTSITTPTHGPNASGSSTAGADADGLLLGGAAHHPQVGPHRVDALGQQRERGRAGSRRRGRRARRTSATPRPRRHGRAGRRDRAPRRAARAPGGAPVHASHIPTPAHNAGEQRDRHGLGLRQEALDPGWCGPAGPSPRWPPPRCTRTSGQHELTERRCRRAPGSRGPPATNSRTNAAHDSEHRAHVGARAGPGHLDPAVHPGLLAGDGGEVVEHRPDLASARAGRQAQGGDDEVADRVGEVLGQVVERHVERFVGQALRHPGHGRPDQRAAPPAAVATSTPSMPRGVPVASRSISAQAVSASAMSASSVRARSAERRARQQGRPPHRRRSPPPASG